MISIFRPFALLLLVTVGILYSQAHAIEKPLRCRLTPTVRVTLFPTDRDAATLKGKIFYVNNGKPTSRNYNFMMTFTNPSKISYAKIGHTATWILVATTKNDSGNTASSCFLVDTKKATMKLAASNLQNVNAKHEFLRRGFLYQEDIAQWIFGKMGDDRTDEYRRKVSFNLSTGKCKYGKWYRYDFF